MHKRILTIMCLVLWALPLLASVAKADFTAGYVSVPSGTVSAYTDNQPIIGFDIPCGSNDTLKTLAVKSYMERAFSVVAVKLWVEDNYTPGFQSTDCHLTTNYLWAERFETEDTIVIRNINFPIYGGGGERDTFYLTIDAYTDSVNANPDYFNQKGLEVTIEPGYIHLGLTSGEVNTNRIANPGYVPADPGPPPQPPFFDPFILLFDTQYITGDVNSDGVVDIGDVVFLVSFLYRDGPAPNPVQAGDANCDGVVNVADVVYLVNYLYRGGDPPEC